MNKKVKVLVAGPFDSGKTTFIKTANMECYDGVEVPNFDPVEIKELSGTTTVGLDISHINFNGIDFILVGLPGQKRFSFLWDTLGNDYDAILILHSAELPLSETEFYVSFFSKTPSWRRAKKLIILTKRDLNPGFDAVKLSEFGLPVLSCDPRNKEDVYNVLMFLYNTIRYSLNKGKK
ncbi:hypothetical protein [Desulfurobacterium sp.]